jgi:CHAT domain-containing protein
MLRVRSTVWGALFVTLGCRLSWLLLLGRLGGAEPEVPKLPEERRSGLERGEIVEAAAKWEKALHRARESQNLDEEVRAALSLAGVYQATGQQRRAVQVLDEVLTKSAGTTPATKLGPLKGRLGGALIMIRDLERAGLLLQQALELAEGGDNLGLKAEVLNEMGNLAVAQGRASDALSHYEATIAAARQVGNFQLLAGALCNAASSSIGIQEYAGADRLNSMALKEIEGLGGTHAKAFLLLTAGQVDRRIKLEEPEAGQRLRLRAHRSFQQALELAGELRDLSLETYALGYLAQIYMEDEQPKFALELARRAAFSAQQAQMPEALYRWEWLQGRLLRSQGVEQEAIEAYRRAVQTLEPIRSDVALGHGNAGTLVAFREGQGPLFFELADLLLMASRSAATAEAEQSLLREARDTVEHLKAVELNDYFCDDCVDLQRSRVLDVEIVDPHTAVLYLIPLSNRTEVLLGLSSGLKRFTVDHGAEELTAVVTRFRRALETRTTYGYRAQAQQLYDWLIRPIRPLLREQGINTLVLVPDGALRTIPFGTLHDGERFLIQDLAVATVPGLSLVASQPMEHGNGKLLLGGLSESVQGFPALDFVPDELHSLKSLYPGETLLNEGYTLRELRRKLEGEQYSIVHIASHGQFDRDVRNTFVLTYDTKLTLNILESLIRPSQYRGRPVEMLVLSACQTAAGDDRAALGLAGVAVKAGARSALASLWFVNDQSTSALITEVYRQMRSQPGISKARALQAAQVRLLTDRRYRHPCYWAPFLVIGNWL